MTRYTILLLLLFSAPFARAQEQDTAVLEIPVDTLVQTVPDAAALRQHINTLSSKGFAGRGYVNRGMQKAAAYITQQYKQSGLQPFSGKFSQPFSYKVNTFPSVMDVKVDEQTLEAGVDYLADPSSNGIQAEARKLRVMDGMDFATMAAGKKGAGERSWQKWSKKMSRKKFAYLLEHMDTVKKIMQWSNNDALLQQLPEGLFLLRKKGKPTWSVSQEAVRAAVVELYDSSLVLRKNDKITATIQNRFLDKFATENIIGFVPGTAHADSFIVVTAHYDHLGKMGNRAMFPGASDNASGVAMLLNLARYYAAHPQPYSIAFITFSGEEAGLLGSAYYTQHPVFPMQQIRFLVNLDIMGDASQGITVVNGSAHQQEFDLLTALNKQGGYLPDVRIRGKAANSDHYLFSELGVPAIFIYTNGGKGYYHDTWDKADQVSLNRTPELQSLLLQFIAALQ